MQTGALQSHEKNVASERDRIQCAGFVCGFFCHLRLEGRYRSALASFAFSVIGKITKSQLLTGLRQATNDTIEAFSSASPQKIVALDNACRDNDVLTFTEVRRRFSRQYKSILKRQRIARDSDYYLINGIVNDMESALSDDERHGLEALITAYEATIKPR